MSRTPVRPADDPLTQLTLAELRTRTSVKWRAHPPDVLPLWVAEMDTPLAPPVAAALHDAGRRGDTGYAAGGEEYAAAADAFTRARWGWRVPVDRTALVPDVMRGIAEILRVVTAPGGTVVVNCPVYTPFYAVARDLGRRVAEAPLTRHGRLDVAALHTAFRAASAAGGSPAYLLAGPHNPTGAVHTRDELAEVAALARRYGVRVLADEIHAPLTLDGARHTPYLSLPGTGDAFALLSASKAWNLAGLKAALAVAGQDAAADLARMPAETAAGASHLGVLAHIAAWRDGGPWLDALTAGLSANRDLLAGLLAEHLPGVRYRPQQGTYLAWLDCRELGLGEDPAAFWLREARVAVNSGPAFGTGGEDHVRLNTAAGPDVLTEAVQRMAQAVRERGTPPVPGRQGA